MTAVCNSPPMPATDRKVLRVVSAYVVEWNAAYPTGLYGNQFDRQFTFLPHAFGENPAQGRGLILSTDMNGKPHARSSDGTLQIISDATGLLIRATLVDTAENRRLCQLIDGGRVRGWSHKFAPVLFGSRVRREGGVEFTDHHAALLKELTIVIHKRPRAATRRTPIFLTNERVSDV